MRLVNFRKESSERSDGANWVKAALVEHGVRIESLEGCSQDPSHRTTHVFERARVDLIDEPSVPGEVHASLLRLEGEASLHAKIRLCRRLGLDSLTYVLYALGDGVERVYVGRLTSAQRLRMEAGYASVAAFGAWLAAIKGWRSDKPFRERRDLPAFDAALRQSGTPWPSNVDAFVCDAHGEPLALVEFQNAERTGVARHSNNAFFWAGSDVRRWRTLELLRVATRLPLFVLTWSRGEDVVRLKQIEKVVFPAGTREERARCIEALRRWSRGGRGHEGYERIRTAHASAHYELRDGTIVQVTNHAPLSIAEKTFPKLYYARQQTLRRDEMHVAAQVLQGEV